MNRRGRKELLKCERYLKMKNCVHEQLKGYADLRIREKYIWLKKEIDRIMRKLALEEGDFIIDF